MSADPADHNRRELLQIGATLAMAGAQAAPARAEAGTAGGLPPLEARPAFKSLPASIAVEFRRVVGAQWVFTDAADLGLYRDYYSPFRGEPEERTCSAAVAPASTEEVRAIARIANARGVPLYPISTGRNLGYGGSAPALSGSVVLDLKRMNRIIEVSERNAFALVEPGVSYIDLARYIREHGLKLWVDAPTPGWGSPIGNALDHGTGFTRVDFRNHFEAHCGLEVVLANGDLVRTGMGAMPNSPSWQHSKYGVGPALDGLFMQSNFGIVTKMGVWLMPQPEAMLTGEIHVPRYGDIVALVDLVTWLENSRVFNGHPEFGSPVFGMRFGRGPDAGQALHPDLAGLLARGKFPEPAKLDAIARSTGQACWGCRLTFYGAPEVIQAQWRQAKKAGGTIAGAWFKDGDERRFPLTDVEVGQLDGNDVASVGYAGMSAYDIGPLAAQGAVGHVFVSSVIPRTGEAVLKANEVFREAASRLGFPAPPVYLPTASIERSFRIVNGFPVMPDAEANRKMRAQVRGLLRIAAEQGWGECRSSPAFYDDVMATYAFNDHALLRLCEQLKDAVDPNGILSAGRYGIWPAHLRKA